MLFKVVNPLKYKVLGELIAIASQDNIVLSNKSPQPDTKIYVKFLWGETLRKPEVF